MYPSLQNTPAGDKHSRKDEMGHQSRKQRKGVALRGGEGVQRWRGQIQNTKGLTEDLALKALGGKTCNASKGK